MQDLNMIECTLLESRDEIDRLASGELETKYKNLHVAGSLIDYLIEVMGDRVVVDRSVRLR